jgi:hypothetical protein
MDMQTVTAFFMWCTIINFGFLMIWFLGFMVVSDLSYRLHNKWFPMSRDTFNVSMYVFLGVFKLLVIVFNAVPYVVLLIIG